MDYRFLRRCWAGSGRRRLRFNRVLSLPTHSCNPLGGDVIIAKHGEGTVWEGFVDSVSFTGGRVNSVVGPVLGIGNKIRVAYNKLTYNIPGVVGGNVTTDWYEDGASIHQFGVLEESISGGDLLESEAAMALEMLASRKPYPDRSIDLSPTDDAENSGVVQVEITCAGYYRLLDKRLSACLSLT